MNTRKGKAEKLEDLFPPVPEGHISINGRLVDMRTNASALNSLVDIEGAPPPGFIPQVEEMYGVKWDAAAGKFVEAES